MTHVPNISGSHAILFFIALDFTSITSYINNWALFSFWLSLFILSGAISPLFFSSILGTYRPGEFIFQCHIFFPFHTVHLLRCIKFMLIFKLCVQKLSILFISFQVLLVVRHLQRSHTSHMVEFSSVWGIISIVTGLSH